VPTRARLAAIVFAAAVWASADVADAGAPTDTLRDFFAAGARILLDPGVRDDPEAALAAARRLVHGVFDVHEAAQQVLGREWTARTAAEQREFVRLFGDLVERAYLAQVVARLRGEDGVRVAYVGETIDGATALVDSVVEGRGGEAVPFQYRMARRGERWMIRDVAVDGVSLLDNYRAQFARSIRRSSYADTIALLRERSSLVLAQVPAAATPPAAWPDPPAREPGLARTPPGHSGAAGTHAVTAPPVSPARSDSMSAPTPAAASRSVSAPSPAVAADPGAVTAATPRAVAPEPRSASLTPFVVTAPPAPPAIIPPVHPVATRDTRPSRAGLETVTSAYWVQIGAFRDAGRARRLIAQLGSLRAAIATAADSLVRVRVGPFVDRTAAASTLQQMEGRGFRAFIVETKGALLPER
jgi:phospholipid transport system substrate-binding protein